MRQQNTIVYTEKGKRKIVIVFGVVVTMVILAAFGRYMYQVRNPVYEPPKFDKTAKKGIPEPDESLGYGEISAEGGFSFSIVGTLYQQKDGSLQLYFTNPEDSGINMQCEVADRKGNILYKTGVVKSGEYVKEAEPLRKIENVATDITVSIYAFEPDTWYSKGTISLDNVLQPY